MTEALTVPYLDDGLDAYLDTSDMIVAQRVVIQGSFSVKAVADKVGHFYDKLSGRTFETITAVPLLYWRHSSCLEGKYPNSEVKCWTPDFYKPGQSIEKPYSQTCRILDPKTKRLELVCPKAKWTEDSEGNKHAPACAERWSFVFFDVNNDEMFKLTLKGLSLYRKPLSPVRRWLAYVVASRKKLWFHQVTLGTTPSDNGKAQIVTFSDQALVSEPEKYEALVRQLTYTPVISEDHDEPDASFDFSDKEVEHEPIDATPY